jgi:hypothetical protein
MTHNVEPMIPDREWLAVNLMGLAEIRKHLTAQRGYAVSKQRAWNITQHSGFPPPVTELAAGKLWLRPDVDEFLASERSPGVTRQERSP